MALRGGRFRPGVSDAVVLDASPVPAPVLSSTPDFGCSGMASLASCTSRRAALSSTGSSADSNGVPERRRRSPEALAAPAAKALRDAGTGRTAASSPFAVPAVPLLAVPLPAPAFRVPAFPGLEVVVAAFFRGVLLALVFFGPASVGSGRSLRSVTVAASRRHGLASRLLHRRPR